MLNFSTLETIKELDELRLHLDNCFCIDTNQVIENIKIDKEVSTSCSYDFLKYIFSVVQAECSEYDISSYIHVLKNERNQNIDLNLLEQLNTSMPLILEQHCLIQCLYTLEYMDSIISECNIPLEYNEKPYYKAQTTTLDNGILKDNSFIAKAVNITFDQKRYRISNFLPQFSQNLMKLHKRTKYRSILNRAKNEQEKEGNRKKEYIHTFFICSSIEYFSEQYNLLTPQKDELCKEKKPKINDLVYTYHKNRLYGFDLTELLFNQFAYQYQLRSNKVEFINQFKYNLPLLKGKKEYCTAFDSNRLSQFITECLNLPNVFTRKFILKKCFCTTNLDTNIILETTFTFISYLNKVLFPIYEKLYIYIILKFFYSKDNEKIKKLLFDTFRTVTYDNQEIKSLFVNYDIVQSDYFNSIKNFMFIKNNMFRSDDTDKSSHTISVNNSYQILFSISKYQDNLIIPQKEPNYKQLRILAKKLSITEMPHMAIPDKSIYANFLSRFQSFIDTNNLYFMVFKTIIENQRLNSNFQPSKYMDFDNWSFSKPFQPNTFCRISFRDEIALLDTDLRKSFNQNMDLFTTSFKNFLTTNEIDPCELITYPYYKITYQKSRKLKALYLLNSCDNYDMATFCNQYTKLADAEYYTYIPKKDLNIVPIPTNIIHRIWGKLDISFKDILPLQYAFDIYKNILEYIPDANGFKYKSSIGEIYILFNLSLDNDMEEIVEHFPV